MAQSSPSNAVSLAKTPTLDYFLSSNNHTSLSASSSAVGLSWGEAGNSEVGHLNIGAGRVVWQELPRINRAIEDNTFFNNPALISACQHAKTNKSDLHLMGLLSPGAVHSHIDHLFALLSLAKWNKVKNVYLHLFTDGRDSPPKSAYIYLDKLMERLKEIKLGKIASLSGRYFAMDRDHRWQRTQKAYDALVYGKGRISKDASTALNSAYQNRESDEFIKPTVITDEKNEPIATIKDNDAVIFFNIRADRARQITQSIVRPFFTPFPTHTFNNLKFVCMTMYDLAFKLPVAFPPPDLRETFGQVVSQAGLWQLRLAETEKYAHVTYFFNGGIEKPFAGEDRVLIPSPKIATYDLQPAMSSALIAKELIRKIAEKKYALIVVNFANPDMVAHTGNIQAAKAAIESVDACLAEIFNANHNFYQIAITADHGNIEQMINPETSEVETEHSSNPVPFIFISNNHQPTQPKKIDPSIWDVFATTPPTGVLADIAPTCLEAMNIPKPNEMTGYSLISSMSQ